MSTTKNRNYKPAERLCELCTELTLCTRQAIETRCEE